MKLYQNTSSLISPFMNDMFQVPVQLLLQSPFWTSFHSKYDSMMFWKTKLCSSLCSRQWLDKSWRCLDDIPILPFLLSIIQIDVLKVRKEDGQKDIYSKPSIKVRPPPQSVSPSGGKHITRFNTKRCISSPDQSIKLRPLPPELPPRNTPRNSDTFEPELPPRNTPRNSDTFESNLDLPERKTFSKHSISSEPPSSPPTYREAMSSPDYMEVMCWINKTTRTLTSPRWRVSLPPALRPDQEHQRNLRETRRATATTANRLSTKMGRRSTRTETFSTQGASSDFFQIVGKTTDTRCFVCAQCFRPFEDGVFFEFEGRKYCQHDFQVLDFENINCSRFWIFRTWNKNCSRFCLPLAVPSVRSL